MTHRKFDRLRVLNKKGQEPRLIGTQCTACNEPTFPPRDRCPSCGSSDTEPIRFDRTAQLETFTVVHVPQAGFKPPYPVGYVRLSPGSIRVFTPLGGDGSGLSIGARVYPTTLSPETAGVPEPMWGFTPEDDE